MKKFGMYKDKEVWGCSRAEYEDIYDNLDNEIYYLINNNQLVYRNRLIGLVDRNWNVTDVTPKIFYEPPVCCSATLATEESETCHERSEVCCVTSFATNVDAVLASAFEPLVMEPVELGVYNEEVEK